MSEVGLHKDELDTPILWVDLNQLEQNIKTMAAHFASTNVQWRPHTKGVKVPAIAHKAIAAGAIGVTCAKLGEAEIMAAAGISDILVANQVVGPHKVKRLVNLQSQADVKVAVDHPDNVRAIGAAASDKGVEVGVLVEINTGMNRAGVLPGDPALALSQLAYDTAGVRYDGLMAWEGHSLAHAEAADRKAAIEKSVGQLQETVELCRQSGPPIQIISGGGSGTSGVTPFLGCVTEMQSGGSMFCDVTYHNWWSGTEPSLYVRTMVTSRPAPERVIFDAGFKSLPSAGRVPHSPALPKVKQMGSSAEHGVVTLEEANETIQIGEAYDFIVGYGDATLFLHDHLYGIRDDVVEVVWPIQGRGKLR